MRVWWPTASWCTRSTPAYQPVFALHGYRDLRPELAALAREGRWAEGARLIDDDLIETVAVCGEPDEVAPKLRERLDGISDSVSLVKTGPRIPGSSPRSWPP